MLFLIWPHQNKFNSKVYAKLCCELKEKYEFMTDIIENNIFSVYGII